MESILEFMYLGVATFYQDRMNEFLNVAKNLEIKEISKDVEFHDGGDVRSDDPEIADHEENTEVEAEPQTNCGEDIDTNSVKNKQMIDPSQLQRTSEGSIVTSVKVHLPQG